MMESNIQQSEFADAALLGFNLSQAAIADPKKQRHQHRARLRKRCAQGEDTGLTDSELLELVLFRALPHHDVGALCQRLLKYFGTFNAVITASEQDLRHVKGVGQAVVSELKIVQTAACRMAKLKVIGKDVLSSWDQLMAYCRTRLGHLKYETFHALFLDTKNALIAEECLQSGIVNHVPVYPRQVAKRALELDASAVILVHNHPSGDPEPSPEDITVTHDIVDALQALSIRVHDHVIIGTNGTVSLKSRGMI